MLVVDLALELIGDAVREPVVVFNPPAPLGVLDGHGCHTCAKQRDVYMEDAEER